MANSTISNSLAIALDHLIKAQPIIPTYLVLIASALLPIYAGAHASLHRPVSAAKLPKQDRDAKAIEAGAEEETDLKQGFELRDVLLSPLAAGTFLSILYVLITRMDEVMIVIITNLLNAYMSVFGLIGIYAFLSDGLEATMSYIFPLKYREQGRVWVVDTQRHITLPVRTSSTDIHPGVRHSPWPSRLAALRIWPTVLWRMTDFVARPAFVIELQFFDYAAKLRPTPLRILCAQIAVSTVLYFNFVDRAWWLTSVLGLSFTYSAFQVLSVTSFRIGSVFLVAMLLYDIYMVFFTPLMITVATKLDIPAKIMVPNPQMAGRNSNSFSILGLGDIVIPGMIVAMALRFDLYLHYLRKQKIIEHSERGQQHAKKYVKATYQKATGSWGERFWLGSGFEHGGNFSKVYFWASMIGYLSGLLVTLAICQIYEHGQPALLYLVPGVLISLWTTACVRGEAAIMWRFTEDADEGRDAGIDSAAILNNDASLELVNITNPGSNEVEPVDDHTSTHSEDTDSKTHSSEASSAEMVSVEDVEGYQVEGHQAEGKIVPKDKDESAKELRETKERSDVNTTPDRCLFKLIISIPASPKPSIERQGSTGSQTSLSAADHSTIDWANGAPLAKRLKRSS